MMIAKEELVYSNENQVLVRKFTGDVSFGEVLDSWKNIVENGLLNKNTKGVLNDFLDARLLASVNDIPEILAYFKSKIEIFRKVKLAVVMDRPDQIVLPFYAQQQQSEIKIRAFSTVESARKWILQEKQ